METLQRTANRGSISTGYDIDNSLKLDGDNNERMQRTSTDIGTPTNAKIATLSFWAKRSALKSDNAHFSFIANAGANSTFICFEQDKARVYTTGGNSLMSNALFRDTSAWYHFVAAFDMTQGTASNRVKIYINGVQITSFETETYGTQNNDIGLYDLNMSHYIGFAGSQGWFGYIAEAHLIDGQQLAPTEFGESDEDSGIWKPKAYGGTYGNEGYYLDMSNASNLGEDQSGNDNDFTALYNIAAADQATDTPTNNFCTLNFNTGYIQGSDATTFTQGATTRQGGSSSYNGALGTIGINPFVGSAKWYWEVELSADCDGDGIELGAGWLATSIIQSTTEDKATAGNSAGFQIWTSFNYDPPNEGTGADGDVFGFLLQCDSSNPDLKIYKNDTLFTTRHTATSYDFENDFYFPVVFIYNTGIKAFFNFGNPFDATVSSGNTDPNGYGNFEFDPKGGYALCTKNLAEFG
jgi:hypothetical protein